MLKHLKFLILLVLPFSLAMALTSCSDDDNENLEDGNEETSLLVGSWVFDDDYDSETWTFNANGTYKWSVDNYILTGKYRYDSSTGILLISLYDAEDDETWTDKWRVLSLSSLELRLEPIDAPDYDFYDIITLTRKI